MRDHELVWFIVLAGGLCDLKGKVVAAGMPEEDVVRIFANALDEAVEVYLREKKNRQLN